MTTPDQLLSTLRSVMDELGIPQRVETNEQAHDRLSAALKLLMAPYLNRPRILVQAELMADLQALNLLLLCFLFQDNSAAKEMLNLMHENLLEELNDPTVRKAVASGHRAVAAARGHK